MKQAIIFINSGQQHHLDSRWPTHTALKMEKFTKLSRCNTKISNVYVRIATKTETLWSTLYFSVPNTALFEKFQEN